MIEMHKVDALTISEENTGEFIVHVKGEYDYRFMS